METNTPRSETSGPAAFGRFVEHMATHENISQATYDASTGIGRVVFKHRSEKTDLRKPVHTATFFVKENHFVVTVEGQRFEIKSIDQINKIDFLHSLGDVGIQP